MSFAFTASPGPSIGMEMEFQLVDAHTFDLVDGVMPLLEHFPQHENIKSEFIQNTIEVASDPCADPQALALNLRSLVEQVTTRAQHLGMRLCGAGTHPFSTRLALITPLPRYLAMARSSGITSRNQITFATHVHIGVQSGDEAVLLMRELKPYLPVLIALSASSPLWRGYNTGYAAYRQRILASGRSYGLPPDFNDWASFEQFLDSAMTAEIFASINDIHWDIRPRPHLGTVEVRVMDAQATVTDAVTLGSLVRTLIMFLRATRNTQRSLGIAQDLHWWSLKDNCFTASRNGLEAKIIVSNEGQSAPLRQIVAQILQALPEYALTQYEAELLHRLIAAMEQRPYVRQLKIADEHDLPAVVEDISDQLTNDLANANPCNARDRE